MVLFTLRRISKGEQLLFDYGPAYWQGRSPPVLATANAAVVPPAAVAPPPDPCATVEAPPPPEVDWDVAMEELD